MVGGTTFILDGIWGRPARLAGVRRAIEDRGGVTEMFPYQSNGTGCLRSAGERFAAAVRRHGKPVTVLAFSMGGLVVRAAHAVDPTLPIQRAVFLNTPHQGSWWCYLSSPLKGLRSLHQMRPGSEFLRRLHAVEWTVPTLVTWCPFDLFVFPGESARWPSGAVERLCCSMPLHEWPMYSKRVRQRVVAFLNAE